MKQFVHRLSYAFIALFIFSSLASAQFQVQKIRDNGSTAAKVNLVILGDGYTSSEQTKFWTDAQTVINGFFNTAPYNGSISSSFNVFAVGVVSQASGAGASPSQPINNYFGSTFYYDGVTQRLLYPTNLSLVFSTAAQYVPEYDQAILLVNSSTYGGGGGAVATLSTAPQAVDLLLHEFAHSYGNLWDEYWNGTGVETFNMTRNGHEPPWNQYIGQSDIGSYPYEESPSWFRPHQNCKMRYLNGAFCLVCSNRLVDHTNFLAGSGCTPTTITPYIDVNGGGWQQTSGVTVSAGSTIKFGPQPFNTTSWSWTGCGLSGTSREQTFTATGSCTATVTYTNSNGCPSTQTFAVTVTNGCTGAPSTPGGLASSVQTVSWNSVAEATSYTLQQWTGSAWITVATPTTNSATLNLNGNYYFQVSASNNCGMSAYSPYSFLTLGAGCSVPTIPNSPTVSNQTVSWNSVPGASGYTLERWDGANWVYEIATSETSHTLNLTGTYYFQVSASNACGSSAFSPFSQLTLSPACTSAPTKPNGLTVSGQTVSWNSVAGAASYTLQRKSGLSWVTVGTPSTNSATLSLTGSYSFRVSATNSCGTSTYSNTTQLTLTASPAPIDSEETPGKVVYYPNPATDIVHIINPFLQEAEVKIYSPLGTIVGEHKLPQQESIVDISTLNNGVYLFRVVSGARKTSAFRIVKK